MTDPTNRAGATAPARVAEDDDPLRDVSPLDAAMPTEDELAYMRWLDEHEDGQLP